MRLKELIDKKTNAKRELAELSRREEELNREVLEAEMAMVDINISNSTVYLPDEEELHQTDESGKVVKIHISADQIADLYVSIFGEPEEDEEEEDDPFGGQVTNAAGNATTLQKIYEDFEAKPGHFSLADEKFYYRLSGEDRKVIISGTLDEVLDTIRSRGVDQAASVKYTIELVTRTGRSQRIAYSRRFYIGGNHG